MVERARKFVLEFFNAPEDEYVCIFTQNASAALKIVGEAYPFGEGCRYLLAFDNHNSVNGIREYAHARGASVTYIPVVLPDLRINQDQLFAELETARPGLFQPVLPTRPQSNFSGVQHPLEWIAQAQDLGWDVLLDAAAFVPTNRLDLSRWKPDYVPLSFYKMFRLSHRCGRPAGTPLGHEENSAVPGFAGGHHYGGFRARQTSTTPPKHRAAFEDGTLDYLNIPAVEIGLRHIQDIGYENHS